MALDGPDMPPKDVTEVIEWAQAYRRKPLPMLLNGPSNFMTYSADGVEWAQHIPKKLRQ